MKINREEEYEVENYRFKNFAILDIETIEKIRVWRNHPSIRNVMYNSDEIDQDQHQEFINSLSIANDKYYWLVYKDNIPIGVCNIVDFDNKGKNGQLGYYMLPDFLESGLGLEFISKILNFLFIKLGVKKIFGRTEFENKNALVINYHLGFRFRPEIVEIKGNRYFEQDIVYSDFLERNKQINDPRQLQKSIREFNCIYKNYKA